MPSMKTHGLTAFLLLAIVGLGTYLLVNSQSEPDIDKMANGPEVRLPEQVTPEDDIVPAELPDLLAADNIPLDANPTENIALIGAPDTTAPISGPRPPNTAELTNPEAKTILIDGSAVNGSEGSLNTSQPLTRAPIQGLSRTSPFGKVPHPSTDGRSAYKSYAKPFTPAAGKTQIALVVGGLGVNNIVTRRAISELPGEVTLSFAAETPDLQTWINQARARGHEVLIELPMESADFNPLEPGAVYTLMTTAPDSENIRNLDYLLSRGEGYFGVTNYGGDKNRSSVRSMISTLRPSGSVKVPIGMGFSYGSTVDGVKDWIVSKPANVELAPASFAMTQNK